MPDPRDLDAIVSAQIEDIDISGLPDPVDPLWARLMLCRAALQQPAGSMWNYAVGDLALAVNETPLEIPLQEPRPFLVPPDTAIAFIGTGVIGYVAKHRARFMDPVGREAVRAMIEETCRERVAEIRAQAPAPFAGMAVCEECGVPLGEFAGDQFRPDRAGGVCEQCLAFGRGWLNREPRRFG